MKLSRTVSYAVKAMVALAEESRDSPTCCKDLAEAGEMPERFLLQILRTLVTHGLLSSVRGVYGGYRIARDPHEITLLEIIEAIDGPFSLRIPDASVKDATLEMSLGKLSKRLRSDFADVKLSDLMDHHEGDRIERGSGSSKREGENPGLGELNKVAEEKEDSDHPDMVSVT